MRLLSFPSPPHRRPLAPSLVSGLDRAPASSSSRAHAQIYALRHGLRDLDLRHRSSQLKMRTANEYPHINPLALHAPAPGAMNGTAPAPPAPSLPRSPDSATPARPSTASDSQPNLPAMNGNDPDAVSLRRPSSTRTFSRPQMLRAKSDFGPRHFETTPSDSGAEEAASVDGQFKIRHGWDDQLNSEEYNQLLTSVGSARRRIGMLGANDRSLSSCIIRRRNTRPAAYQRARVARTHSRNGACATA